MLPILKQLVHKKKDRGGDEENKINPYTKSHKA